MERFEAYAIVDSDGNIAYGTSEEEARERYEQEIDQLGALAWRLIRIPFNVTLPAALTEAPEVTIPDEV